MPHFLSRKYEALILGIKGSWWAIIPESGIFHGGNLVSIETLGPLDLISILRKPSEGDIWVVIHVFFALKKTT